MTVQIRRAAPEDVAAIAALHVRTWHAAYRGLVADEALERLSVHERQDLWQRVLSREEASAVYVALEDETVIGFCAVGTPSRDDDAEDGVAEIGALYVDPDSWRNGIGRALMEVALADLRAGGWRWVTLWVLAENHRAREFYARLGFEPDGAEMTHARSGGRAVRLRGRGSLA